MDPTYPLLPIVNWIAFVLVLLPLTTSIRRAWNVGVISFSLWIASQCLFRGVNTIVWADNVNNIAPVWCDISKLYN